MLIFFVKLAVSSSDYRADILTISDFETPHSDPNREIRCFTLGDIVISPMLYHTCYITHVISPEAHV